MTARITSDDSSILNVTADSPTTVPLTVAGAIPGPQTADLIVGQYTQSGTTLNIFSVTPAGQVRVASANTDAATPLQGIVLVKNFGGGGTDFDIDNLTNSVGLFAGAAVAGQLYAHFANFTPTGADAFVMMADDLLDSDVATGWAIDRELLVSGGLRLGAVGGNYVGLQSLGLTGTRIVSFGNYTGLVPIAGTSSAPASGEAARINLTAQSATIASTKLTNAHGTGYYRVHYILADTATQVGVATAQFAIQYTDDVGSTSQTGAALTLTAAGYDRGSFEVYLASGDITYTTTVVGVVGTGRYSLRVRVEALG